MLFCEIASNDEGLMTFCEIPPTHVCKTPFAGSQKRRRVSPLRRRRVSLAPLSAATAAVAAALEEAAPGPLSVELVGESDGHTIHPLRILPPWVSDFSYKILTHGTCPGVLL